MNEHEFSALIKRYEAGLATQEEIALIEKWLDARGGTNKFNSISQKEEESIRDSMLQNVLRKIPQGVSGNSRIGPVPDSYRLNSRSTILKGFLMGMRIAASILVLAALSYSIWYFTGRSAAQEIAIIETRSTGEINKVILNDGSIVWLKGRSKITYPEVFSEDQRNVSFQGEALFEVASDPDRPFIIQCGGFTARVLGTSFNIKTVENNIEVVVLTGKVSLSAANVPDLLVMPNEKAVYNHADKVIAKAQSVEEEAAVAIKGTEYNMKFKATSMNEIIRRVEGKFSVEVSVSNQSIGHCKVTADFTDLSLDRTMSMISQTLGIEYSIQDNQVILTGAGCP